MYNNEVAIPAAFYEYLLELELSVPVDQEIRKKGKGKQYVIMKDDPNMGVMIKLADNEIQSAAKKSSAAKNLLLALRQQGVPLNIKSDISVSPAKAVTRKTAAIGDRRNLIVTITPDGELILRPAGRRKSVSISLSAVYSIVVNAEARKAISDAKKARKEKRMARRAEKDAAVAAFKANPTSITL